MTSPLWGGTRWSTRQTGGALAACAVAVVVMSASVQARYAQVLLDTVPVARVIANLTTQVTARPDDAQAHWALGRAHAMAASAPAREVAVRRGTTQLWLGYEPKYLPYDAVGARRSAQARTHLAKAIAHHERALALGSDRDAAVRLGLGWCLQQAGRTAEAIAAYRAVIAAAWPGEGERDRRPLGGTSLVVEAAGYLLPLLDATKDGAEVRELQARVARIEALPVPITPVLVDLTGTGDVTTLVDREARVAFDLDGRGAVGQWQWITPTAAWIVWDPQASGRITSGTQLFGAVTFLMFWQTGYDALATLDDDGDGWLRGRELRGLALWRDRDGDGISDDGEVRPLTSAGIVAIATRGTRSTTPGVAAEARRGVRLADGRTLQSFDVVLAPAPQS